MESSSNDENTQLSHQSVRLRETKNTYIQKTHDKKTDKMSTIENRRENRSPKFAFCYHSAELSVERVDCKGKYILHKLIYGGWKHLTTSCLIEKVLHERELYNTTIWSVDCSNYTNYISKLKNISLAKSKISKSFI